MMDARLRGYDELAFVVYYAPRANTPYDLIYIVRPVGERLRRTLTHLTSTLSLRQAKHRNLFNIPFYVPYKPSAQLTTHHLFRHCPLAYRSFQ